MYTYWLVLDQARARGNKGQDVHLVCFEDSSGQPSKSNIKNDGVSRGSDYAFSLLVSLARTQMMQNLASNVERYRRG